MPLEKMRTSLKNSCIDWVSNILNTDFIQQIFNKQLLSNDALFGICKSTPIYYIKDPLSISRSFHSVSKFNQESSTKISEEPLRNSLIFQEREGGKKKL